MKSPRPTNLDAALTLIEVCVVLVVIIGILACIILPTLSKAGGGPRYDCRNNLNQVATALRLWADDNNGHSPMDFSTNQNGVSNRFQLGNVVEYFRAMSNELSTPKILVCPSTGAPIASNFTVLSNLNVTYFLGMDATESLPDLPVAGDAGFSTNGVLVPGGLALINSNSSLAWPSKIHNGKGYVIYADGSVVSEKGFRFKGTDAIRLAVP